MSIGKHNVSKAISLRLAKRQESEIALGTDEDRRRFWAKVRVENSTTACWLWTAAKFRRGYGQFSLASVHGRECPIGAHRAAWELTYGAIPDGAHVLHSCDNRACVNPNHLFLGDHLANMQDAARKGRLSVSRPKRQKVTDAQAAEIVAAVAAGAKQCDLAEQYGVSKSAISQFVRGHRRPWLQPADKRTA